MKKGSIVKILDENEWKNLYGVVRYLKDNIAFIFCVDHPTDLYIAGDENQIIVIEE